MTSILRYTAVLKDTPVKMVGISGPYYYDTIYGGLLLFPFTYNNGVLDIAYVNNFEANMVNSTNNPPLATGGDQTLGCKLMGGNELVTSLGPNFIAYIRAWKIDPTAIVSIYINPVMTKIQSAPKSALTGGNSDGYEEVAFPPSSDEYIWGSGDNAYQTSWIFKSPITIKLIKTNNTVSYITLSSFLYADNY